MSVLDTLQIDYPQQVGKYLRRPAWVVAWNDGDTGHLLTTSKTDDNRWETALFKVRLAHIDAPENVEWRERYKSDFEVFDDSDGNRSIRMKG